MNKWAVCIHEAGHAVVAHVLGYQGTNAIIIPGGKGGFVDHDQDGKLIETPRDARRAALVLFAGPAAEIMFLPPADRISFNGECDLGPNSDARRIIEIAKTWGGSDFGQWHQDMWDRAHTIVGFYKAAIREGAERLMNDKPLTSFTYPLIKLKPRPNLYGEFSVPTKRNGPDPELPKALQGANDGDS